MNLLTTINFISNIVLGYSLTMFYIYLFADATKIVHRWSFVGHWSLRLGLSAMIIGTLFNVLTFDTPSKSQLLMNIGLSIVFVWAYLFHKQLFKYKNQNK